MTARVTRIGNYDVKHKIGEGNFGKVYEGTHTTSGQHFAIKLISKEKIGMNKKMQENLYNEIAIMRDCRHPNIVGLYDSFEKGNNIFLVMELCRGGDLSKFIKHHQRLDERVARSFLRQLSDGLMFLYDRNIMHRDLKSANILLSEFSEFAVVKLADFGMAKLLTRSADDQDNPDMATTQCGTPYYMAPEIFDNSEYDAKADLWSLGCIFYEMIVGYTPFKGNTHIVLHNNQLTKPLSVPADVSVTRDSVLILQQLLKVDPHGRIGMRDFHELCRTQIIVLQPTNSGRRSSTSSSSTSNGPMTPMHSSRIRSTSTESSGIDSSPPALGPGPTDSPVSPQPQSTTYTSISPSTSPAGDRYSDPTRLISMTNANYKPKNSTTQTALMSLNMAPNSRTSSHPIPIPQHGYRESANATNNTNTQQPIGSSRSSRSSSNEYSPSTSPLLTAGATASPSMAFEQALLISEVASDQLLPFRQQPQQAAQLQQLVHRGLQSQALIDQSPNATPRSMSSEKKTQDGPSTSLTQAYGPGGIPVSSSPGNFLSLTSEQNWFDPRHSLRTSPANAQVQSNGPPQSPTKVDELSSTPVSLILPPVTPPVSRRKSLTQDPTTGVAGTSPNTQDTSSRYGNLAAQTVYQSKFQEEKIVTSINSTQIQNQKSPIELSSQAETLRPAANQSAKVSALAESSQTISSASSEEDFIVIEAVAHPYSTALANQVGERPRSIRNIKSILSDGVATDSSKSMNESSTSRVENYITGSVDSTQLIVSGAGPSRDHLANLNINPPTLESTTVVNISTDSSSAVTTFNTVVWDAIASDQQCGFALQMFSEMRELISILTVLGDEYVSEILAPTNETVIETEENAKNVKHDVTMEKRKIAVARKLYTASILYMYALTRLSEVMQLTGRLGSETDCSADIKSFLTTMKLEMVGTFDQLHVRAAQCQGYLSQLQAPVQRRSELQVLYEVAGECSRRAAILEMTGRLAQACEKYPQCVALVEEVLRGSSGALELVQCDDEKRLNRYLNDIESQLRDCQRRRNAEIDPFQDPEQPQERELVPGPGQEDPKIEGCRQGPIPETQLLIQTDRNASASIEVVTPAEPSQLAAVESVS